MSERGGPAAVPVSLIGLLGVLATGCGHHTTTPAPRAPPATDIASTFYLIGDAGMPDPDGEPVFHALAADVDSVQADNRFILFLGDNVYPRGIPDPGDGDRLESERRLVAQIALAENSGAQAIFVPGNHDWDYAGEGRRERLLRSVRFGRSMAPANVLFLPDEACPGPDVVDVGARVRIIVLDTQWWLFPDPVEDVPETCENRSRAEVLAAMRRQFRSAGDRYVIVVGHHPMATGGPHGGYFTLRQHLFPLTEKWKWAWIPLPVIGSIYPIARRSGITDQDLSGSLYRRMRAAFDSIFFEYRPLLYAGGHDHSLQVSTSTSARYNVVSGAGNYGHETPVRARTGTLFATSEAGYMRLDIARNGSARLGVITVDGNGVGREAFSTMLTTTAAGGER